MTEYRLYIYSGAISVDRAEWPISTIWTMQDMQDPEAIKHINKLLALDTTYAQIEKEATPCK